MCDASANDAWPYNRWPAENGPIIAPETILDKAAQERLLPRDSQLLSSSVNVACEKVLPSIARNFFLFSLASEQEPLYCAVKKDFPSQQSFHPSSSFVVLQCYTRGNPFKAREGRVREKVG